METVKYYSRSIFNLTNEELIKLVDFILNSTNLDRIAHSLYLERPLLTRNLTYRKIEVEYAYYDWAYAVTVTLRFEELDRNIKTGFILANEGGPSDNNLYETDIDICSINGFFEPFEDVVLGRGVAAQYGIEFDYSHFSVYVKDLYNFLDKTLTMWNSELTEDKYLNNPQTEGLYKDDEPVSFVVEEVDIVKQPGRMESISK